MKEENAPVLKLSGTMREIPLNVDGKADYAELADAIMTEKQEGMKSYYFTTGSGQPGGSGYWEVKAKDADTALEKMVTYFDLRWAFQYSNLNMIHELDREKCHGVIL